MAAEAAGVVAVSYLLGSVPFGLLTGKWLKGVDIRQFGSGNIGASNVLRLLGWQAAAVVLLLDTLKGFVPVWTARSVLNLPPYVVVAAALASIAGHNWSLFLGFKGGKGVATSLGVLGGLSFPVAGLAVAVWAVAVVVTRYISVGSILAGVAVASVMAAMHLSNQRSMPLPYVALGVVAAVFIVVRHIPNIRRLLAGTETRFGQRVAVDADATEPNT